MRRAAPGEAGVSAWAVVVLLAAAAAGFLFLLGVGGVVWYLASQRPASQPPAPPPASTPAPPAPQPPPAAPPAPGPAPQPAQPPQPPAEPQWPSSGAPAPAQVSYDTYMDPEGEFCVKHPVGWQVLPHRAGVVFAPRGEDPQEGVSALFTRMLGVTGRVVPARQDLEHHFEAMRRRYPDVRVVSLSVEPMPQESERAFVQAMWTNLRREPMQGVLLGLYLHSRVANFTMKQWRAFQAQRVAWRSLEPVFMTMARSYTPVPQNRPPTEADTAPCR